MQRQSPTRHRHTRRRAATAVLGIAGAALTLGAPAVAAADPLADVEGALGGSVAGSTAEFDKATGLVAGAVDDLGAKAAGSVDQAARGSAAINPGDVVSALMANTGSAVEIVDGLAARDSRAVLEGIIHGIQGVGAATGSLAPTQGCNATTMGGGAGVTSTRHEIGRPGPTAFVLRHETYSIPDRIEVFYEGNRIHDTGYIGDDTNEGTGQVVVGVPPGLSTSVLVRITGPNNTEWDYTVNCPLP